MLIWPTRQDEAAGSNALRNRTGHPHQTRIRIAAERIQTQICRAL